MTPAITTSRLAKPEPNPVDGLAHRPGFSNQLKEIFAKAGVELPAPDQMLKDINLLREEPGAMDDVEQMLLSTGLPTDAVEQAMDLLEFGAPEEIGAAIQESNAVAKEQPDAVRDMLSQLSFANITEPVTGGMQANLHAAGSTGEEGTVTSTEDISLENPLPTAIHTEDGYPTTNNDTSTVTSTASFAPEMTMTSTFDDIPDQVVTPVAVRPDGDVIEMNAKVDDAPLITNHSSTAAHFSPKIPAGDIGKRRPGSQTSGRGSNNRLHTAQTT